VRPQRSSDVGLTQLPSKLIDAMAMAKPIIATAVSDIPRYLDGCGLVVEPDAAAIAASLAWVVEHREEAAALGRCARERFLRDFTLEAMLATMSSVIDRLLDARDTRRVTARPLGFSRPPEEPRA
jgi:glycosyltransferase involved in cell wall biosynthesis